MTYEAKDGLLICGECGCKTHIRHMAHTDACSHKAGQELLTAREREISVLISKGVTRVGIALDLGISHRTVSTHLEKVFHKLEINKVAQLTRIVCGWEQSS